MMSSFNYHDTSNRNLAESHEATTPIFTTYDESPRCIGAINKFGIGQGAYYDLKESPSWTDIKEEKEETPAEVAAILTSISSIASREIKEDSSMMKELAEIAFPDLSSTTTDVADGYGMQPEGLMHWQYSQGPALMPIKHRHRHYRGEMRKKRAVSMDSPDGVIGDPNSKETAAEPTLLQWRSINNSKSYDDRDIEQVEGGIFTPPHSSAGKHPIMFGTPNCEYRRYNYHNHDAPFKKTSIAENVKTKYNRPRSASLAEHKGHGTARQKKEARRRHASIGNDLDLLLKNQAEDQDKPIKLISRKKFSWKNYPELEEFLIANREEYLRHSTLNYTMQQKKYNNTLTQRLIELAATHGYQFDPQDFSFVTVRDRIRCYFKSYVQSMKKRGFVIGYAARKAGLVTEEELEASAKTDGKIYIPNHEMEWESNHM